MQSYLKEKIGNPDLFTGRQKELMFFLKWVEGITREISPSMALLSRRKTGKTAILQRLYNLTFDRRDGVIPFYYEVTEGKTWAVEFCRDFFLTFIWQYIAFKTNQPAYIEPPQKHKRDFATVKAVARQEQMDYLLDDIEGIELCAKREQVDTLWSAVREAPLSLATRRNERIVQFIDEFQYLNSEIYWDAAKTNLANDFAAGYMRTAEYKNAPLLISGSWVGWLQDLLHTMLPSRFRQYELEHMPPDETVEMVYKYAQIFDLPVAEEVVYAMAQVSEGNPFYVSALFQSHCPARDFTTPEGLLKTLEFETLNPQGNIRGVWMEYIGKVFYKVNQVHAKHIVLYLSQHRDREIGRDELLRTLPLKMTETQLEEKLDALVKADIIEQGQSHFYYRGVRDNLFDKVFRGVYQQDIATFDPSELTTEYQTLYNRAKADYQRLSGKYNQAKGMFAEFAMITQLRLHAHRQSEQFQAMIHNVPDDFRFVPYEHVWSYKTTRPDQSDIAIDIFAKAGADAYTLIGEVKNRENKAFSAAEAEEFATKAQELQRREQIEKAVLFVFSRRGFTQDALAYFRAHGIAWSDDERWLG